MYFIAAEKELLYLSEKTEYTCEMLFLTTFYAFWNVSQKQIQETRHI